AGTPVKQVRSKKDGCKPECHKETAAKVHGDCQVKDRPKVTTRREDRLVINRTLRRRTST
ncbi:Hypothetical predicted protein, partial [Paramuricea clavata]